MYKLFYSAFITLTKEQQLNLLSSLSQTCVKALLEPAALILLHSLEHGF